MKPIYGLLLLAGSFICHAQAFAQHIDVKTENIKVVETEGRTPSSLKKLGTIKVKAGPGGTIGSAYDGAIAKAKEKAQKLGGNLVRITQSKQIERNGNYQIWGDVYYSEHAADIEKETFAIRDSILNSLIPDTAKYAYLYVYRPGNFTGSAVAYNIHVEDEKVCRIRNNSKCLIKLKKEGNTTIWTRTESRAEKTIDVKFGEAYFLECSVLMGAVVGRPELKLQDDKLKSFAKYIDVDGDAKDMSDNEDVYQK